MFYFLAYFVNVFAILTSIIMVCSKNPVNSVFNLILTFALVTISFTILNVNFATLVLLLVYLGAVIVMFLILVMFINIRIYKVSNLELISMQILLFIFFIAFGFVILKNFSCYGFTFYYLKWFVLYDNIEIIPTLCFHIFNLFSLEVILVAFLLLISMISSMSIVFLEIQNLWKN